MKFSSSLKPFLARGANPVIGVTCQGFLVLMLLVAMLKAMATPVIRVLNSSRAGMDLLQNGSFEDVLEPSLSHWRGWEQGFRVASGEGRNGLRAT